MTRVTDDVFAVSNSIFGQQEATSEVLSLRQCLLYFAALASDEETAYWDIVYGDSLVSTPSHSILLYC